MAILLLLDVDQYAVADRDTLAAIMGCYGATLIAVYPDGAMHVALPVVLIEAFLATVSRDVLPVEVSEPFALVA